MTAVSPELLDQLDALREAATSGRWVFADEIGRPGSGITANILAVDPVLNLSSGWDVAACSHGGVNPAESDADEAARGNARYIEAMHAAMPDLIAALRRVQELAGRLDEHSRPLRQAHDATARWHGGELRKLSNRLRAALSGDQS
jgi:hypothetical protein